jgi:hypothetical protein
VTVRSLRIASLNAWKYSIGMSQVDAVCAAALSTGSGESPVSTARTYAATRSSRLAAFAAASEPVCSSTIWSSTRACAYSESM